MTCYDSQLIRRLTLIRLDDCGRIPLVIDDPTPALKGLAGAIQQVAKSRQIDIPQTNVTKTINGASCTKPKATPTDRGYSFGITFCGSNPLAEVLTGYKTLDMSGANIVGWEDVNISGSPKAAMEIIFTPSADSCTVGVDPQCIAVLVPLLEQWVRSGDETYNGTDVPDLVLTGQTTLSQNLFGNYATSGDLPNYLSHWAPKFANIATGRSWVYSRLITCPAVDPLEDPCALTAIAHTS